MVVQTLPELDMNMTLPNLDELRESLNNTFHEGIINMSSDPPTNRGSECQTVSQGYLLSEKFASRIDWFQGTFELETVDKLSEMKKFIMIDGDQVLHEGDPWHSGKRWEHHGISAYGLMWAWDDPTPERVGKGWICIKGSYLSYLEPEVVHALLRILILDFGVKTTRLDFALDDFSKAVTPHQVLECGFARQFARFKRPPRFAGDAADGSLTVTFGSRFSDKLLRIYDKAKESKGEINAIRWEIEFKDEVAHVHACQFIDCAWEELPYQFVAQAVTGSIEFCEAGKGRRLDRQGGLLRWWQDFKAAIGSVRLPVPRKPQTYERRKAWMRAAWSKTAAMLEMMNDSGIPFWSLMKSITRDGKERLTSADYNLLEVWKHEQKILIV